MCRANIFSSFHNLTWLCWEEKHHLKCTHFTTYADFIHCADCWSMCAEVCCFFHTPTKIFGCILRYRHLILPCWWLHSSHGPDPFGEVGCQMSVSKSSLGPPRAWRRFQPCLARSGLRSDVHSAARCGEQAPTSGQCRPGPTTASWWPASAQRCGRCQTQTQHLRENYDKRKVCEHVCWQKYTLSKMIYLN